MSTDRIHTPEQIETALRRASMSRVDWKVVIANTVSNGRAAIIAIGDIVLYEIPYAAEATVDDIVDQVEPRLLRGCPTLSQRLALIKDAQSAGLTVNETRQKIRDILEADDFAVTKMEIAKKSP